MISMLFLALVLADCAMRANSTCGNISTLFKYEPMHALFHGTNRIKEACGVTMLGDSTKDSSPVEIQNNPTHFLSKFKNRCFVI